MNLIVDNHDLVLPLGVFLATGHCSALLKHEVITLCVKLCQTITQKLNIRYRLCQSELNLVQTLVRLAVDLFLFRIPLFLFNPGFLQSNDSFRLRFALSQNALGFNLRFPESVVHAALPVPGCCVVSLPASLVCCPNKGRSYPSEDYDGDYKCCHD